MSENDKEIIKIVEKSSKVRWRFPHIPIGTFFNNDKFVLIFSVFCALLLWLFMSFNDTEKNPRAITEVPIAIKLSDSAQQAGLKVFSPTDAKAKVWIKGNSLTVNQVSNEDLQVVAQQASSVTAAGNYVFDLSVNSIKKLTNLTDYTVISVEPSSVNVYVDTYVEKAFQIDTSEIKYQIAATSYMNEPTLSTEEVTISGPQQEVDKIARVVLHGDTGKEPLTATKRITSHPVLLDSYGNEIQSKYITLSADSVDITFNVLPRKVLPLSIEFTNIPSGMSLPKARIEIEPNEIEVAGPQETLEKLQELQLTPVDFSTISPATNEFQADIVLPANFKNVSNLSSAKVKVDLGSVTTRQVTIHASSIKFRNLASTRKAQVYTKNLTVTVVGPESEISKITENNLVGQIDMAGKEDFVGQTQMPVSISVSGFNSSWVYGSYKVNVGVTAG